MKKGFLLILVTLACCTLITSCGPMKYVHKEDPTFSFNIPNNTAPDKKEFATEVVRYSSTSNAYRIPRYSVSVFDKPKGFTLAGAGQVAVADIQKSYPATSRFKILEQKAVKLSDGSDAQASKLKFKWIDETTVLKTASVIAVKGDKIIHFYGTTTFSGATSMEKLMENVMTLQLK